MNMLTTIILFLVMLVIIFVAYGLCRKFIFGRVRINKWIPLSIAIVLFIIQMFLNTINQYAAAGVSIFAVLFFLWFMDITQKRGPKNNEKQIVIKPKAKPNRVKKKK